MIHEVYRREEVATIAEHKPELLQYAINQSKNYLPENTDWLSIEKEVSGQESRDKARVFFVIWTYLEKRTRDAMLSVVEDGIRAHDAISSKCKIEYNVLQSTILESTGFEVKIEG